MFELFSTFTGVARFVLLVALVNGLGILFIFKYKNGR